MPALPARPVLPATRSRQDVTGVSRPPLDGMAAAGAACAPRVLRCGDPVAPVPAPCAARGAIATPPPGRTACDRRAILRTATGPGDCAPLPCRRSGGLGLGGALGVRLVLEHIEGPPPEAGIGLVQRHPDADPGDADQHRQEVEGVQVGPLADQPARGGRGRPVASMVGCVTPRRASGLTPAVGDDRILTARLPERCRRPGCATPSAGRSRCRR